MAETKYGKYFISEVESFILGPALARLDDKVIKGCNFYFVHWIMRSTDSGGHGPHIHKDAELLMHIGTNPDDPSDLGGEIELYMGREMEKHVITKTTVVYIPPNFIHCPWIVKRVDRPFLFIEVNQGPLHTEKSFMQLLSKEEREKFLFIDEGFDSEERIEHWPEAYKR